MNNNASIIEKAIEAIIVLNAAMTNIRLYPPSSAMIVNSVDSAHSIFEEIFERHDSIVFAESERNLVISGEPLDEKEQAKPQVSSLIQLMLNLGIKSIAFEKGLEKSELMSFLEIAGKKPDDLREQGGVSKVISAENIKNILIDKKLYVAMDKDQKIVPAEELSEKKSDSPSKTASSNQADSATIFENSERLEDNQKQNTLQHIKDRVNSLLKGDDSVFSEMQVMQALAPTVLDLMAHGKKNVAETIINRIGQGLLNEDVSIRSEAASVLARIGFKLISEKRMAEMASTAEKMAAWIEYETQMPEAYRHICDQLRVMAQYYVLKQQFEDSRKILYPFYRITAGKSVKSEPVQKQAGMVLEKTASEKVMKILEDKVKSSLKGEKSSAGELLSMLGKSDFAQEENIDKGMQSAEKPSAGDDESSEEVKILNQHLEKGDTESAVKMLLDLIIRNAAEKNFEKAGLLREKMMEVNPMALTEIIRSGEIIDEAKSESIDQVHLKRWASLYENFSKEETSTLYYAMKSTTVGSGEIIFRQGDRNSNLYFINKGHLKMSFMQGNEIKFIKELSPGETAGEQSFFNLTVCTVSVTASKDAELNYLERKVLARWKKEGLGIESKLHDYILRMRKITDVLQKNGLDRRKEKRISAAVKTSFQHLELSGQPLGKPVIGTLGDISPGGVSYFTKIPKEKIEGLFEIPRVNLKFNSVSNGDEVTVEKKGTVVAAIHHLYDYTVHVKLDTLLDESVIKDIRESAEPVEEEFDIFADQ